MKDSHECKQENILTSLQSDMKILITSIRGSINPSDSDQDKGILNRLRSVEIKLKIFIGIFMLNFAAMLASMVKSLWQ